MKLEDRKLERKDWAVWGVLFIVETIILLVGITHEGVWLDEAYSVGIIRHPLPEIWDLLKGDVHPPLYFYMLKLFSLVFGESVFWLRAFSGLAVLGLFALGIGPVRRALGKTVGLLFSFLVMVTPIYLGMAQEIRMYTWAAFFVTGAVLYGYLAIAENQSRDWIKCGVLMAAALYTHYYALMAMVIFCGLIMVWFLAAPQQRFKPLFPVTAGLAGLGYLPWLTGFQRQITGIDQGNFWVPSIQPGTIWQTLIYPFGYKAMIYDPLAIVGFWLVIGLIGWGVGSAIWLRRNATVVYLAVLVYGLTLLAALVFSVLFWPILFVRHILPVTSLLLVGAAYGMAQLPHKKLIVGIALIFVILMIPHGLTINQNRFNGPIREINGFLNRNAEPGDIFIHMEPNTWGVFCYYFPNHQQFLYTIHSNPGLAYCRTFHPNGLAGLDLRGFLEKHHGANIWVVDEMIVAQNPAAELFGEKSILDTRYFKILDSWFAVRLYKIKPQ
jgi:4-amino-4-deoxy-L-arabinose transferase-like glycosyltransferase